MVLATLFDGTVLNGGQVTAGKFQLLHEDAGEFFAQDFILNQSDIEAENVLIGGCQTGVDIGDHVAHKGIELDGGVQLLVIIRLLGLKFFKGAADPEPTRHVGAGLAPRKDPGNGPQIIECVGAGALGGP